MEPKQKKKNTILNMMEFELCECGGDDFHLDMKEWERSCTSCGLVSCIDWSLEDTVIAYHYQRDVYFHHLIEKCMEKGAPITNHQKEHIMKMFLESSRQFELKKQMLRRNNYPSFQYALLQIAKSLGIDLQGFIKLPKMKNTMERVIADWVHLNPCANIF